MEAEVEVERGWTVKVAASSDPLTYFDDALAAGSMCSAVTTAITVQKREILF